MFRGEYLPEQMFENIAQKLKVVFRCFFTFCRIKIELDTLLIYMFNIQKY